MQKIVEEPQANADGTEEIRAKKILIHRPEMVKNRIPRYSVHRAGLWRHVVQGVFLLMNVYIAVTFYLWVRYYETAGQTLQVARPAGVEGWLPIAGLLNLKYMALTGEMPFAHAAAMLLLAAFMLVSLLLRKAFCSWLCPVGTFSEFLWKAGKRVMGRTFELPRWADIPLRGLKYLLLLFFVYILVAMPLMAIPEFMSSPYSIVSDVRMLNFFRYASMATGVTVGVLTLASVFVPNFWCRYLCPYGALMGLISMLSPFKIRRDANACIDCEKCAKVCPSRLPVDVRLQMNSPECTGCMSCVDICPAKDALQLSLPPRHPDAQNGDEEGVKKRWYGRKLSGMTVALALLVVVGGTIVFAKVTGYWDNPFTESMYQYYIPRADSIGHF
ncbi:MAG: 4Fe-4S binding protein [Saezia sp.]